MAAQRWVANLTARPPGKRGPPIECPNWVSPTSVPNECPQVAKTLNRFFNRKGPIRLAKTLNRLFNRKGQVWADRYHAHVLKARREVANAVRYVLGNFVHHARQWGDRSARFADAFSSARFLGLVGDDAPVARPHTWLLSVGWRV